MLKLYRWLSLGLLKPMLEKRFFVNPQVRSAIFTQTPSLKKMKRIWFHASSVGELEMLIPVIDALNASGLSEIVVTVFSDSATQALLQLGVRISKQIGSRLIFAGFAPWEGDWDRALSLYVPDLFVSARYEAWPELWAALGARKIPLAVVGAISRRSLRVAQRLVTWMGGTLPCLHFYTTGDSEVAELGKDFSDARILVTGDPRWDRVFARVSKVHPRAEKLIKVFSKLEKPWGIVGSAWISDLEFLGRDLFKSSTVWVVPHEVNEQSIQEFKKLLESWSVSFVRTSQLTDPSDEFQQDSSARAALRCVLVDEMGMLSELYAHADWAFIGGGFGRSIHNTIEPAVHAIPIACGPRGVKNFPEVRLLESLGQLEILKSREDWVRWVDSVSSLQAGERERWREAALAQKGAAARIASLFLTKN